HVDCRLACQDHAQPCAVRTTAEFEQARLIRTDEAEPAVHGWLPRQCELTFLDLLARRRQIAAFDLRNVGTFRWQLRRIAYTGPGWKQDDGCLLRVTPGRTQSEHNESAWPQEADMERTCWARRFAPRAEVGVATRTRILFPRAHSIGCATRRRCCCWFVIPYSSIATLIAVSASGLGSAEVLPRLADQCDPPFA